MTQPIDRRIFSSRFVNELGSDFEAFVTNLERFPTLVDQINLLWRDDFYTEDNLKKFPRLRP
jgi:hypothetical protein